MRQHRGPVGAVGDALRALGSERTGIGNSLGVGASVTLAPMMAGGLIGPLAYNATGSTLTARLVGAGAGAGVSALLLSLLLRGRGSSLGAMSAKLGAGALVGGAMGLLAGGVATDALRPWERSYDVETGVHATPG